MCLSQYSLCYQLNKKKISLDDVIYFDCIYLGTEEKLAACKTLGADVCINYKSEDFVAKVKEETGGKGMCSFCSKI